MILACIGVDSLEVVHCHDHRAQGSIDVVPCLIVYTICPLQVIAHAHRAYGYRRVVGKEQYTAPLREELYTAAYDCRVGKGAMVALCPNALYAETVLALL